MSELRRPLPAVIPFRRAHDEEAGTAAWVKRFLAEMTPRTQYIRDFYQVVEDYQLDMSIDTLLALQQENFEALELLWSGLPPRQADEMLERLAPRWAEYVALRESRAARERGHG